MVYTKVWNTRMSESRELEPWQQRALDAAIKYQGRGTVQVTGRNVGKSVAQQAYKRLFTDLQNKPVEDLVFSEGHVYSQKYYCVEPVGGNWLDMETWCLDTFGSCGNRMWGENHSAPRPAERWYMNNRKFWFRDARDRDWFTVRWSR